MSQEFALVTKSFRGDLGAFAGLCATVDRHMPDARHYVLVDHPDLPLFREFATPRRTILECEEFLPGLHTFNLPAHRLWWRPPFTLVRGWIHQQLAKIAFVARMTEDAAVHLDSDLYLLRALEQGYVFDGERPRLFRRAGGGQGPRHLKWHRTAQSVLGLPATGYRGFDYIGQGVVWSPRVVRAMIARIEEVAGRCWIDVLARQFRFSEYLLYGIFCEQVSGEHASLISPDDAEPWHLSWHYDLSTPAAVDSFVQQISPDHLGVLIQSNLDLPGEQRSAIIRRIEQLFHERRQ